MLCHSERSEESVSVCIIELCLYKQILHYVQNDRDGIIYNQVFVLTYFLLSPPWGELEGALLSAPAHLLHTLHGAYLLEELLQF